jgi:hypothetical protein
MCRLMLAGSAGTTVCAAIVQLGARPAGETEAGRHDESWPQPAADQRTTDGDRLVRLARRAHPFAGLTTSVWWSESLTHTKYHR